MPSKVGSSTWGHHLEKIRGVSECKIGDKLGLNFREVFQEALYGLPKGIDVVDAKNILVTFAFVRHPFKHVLSLWADKYRQTKPKKHVEMLIAYVKGGISKDRHKAAQSSQCPFCSMDFDLIGTLDDMEQHLFFLTKTLDIQVRDICPIADLQWYYIYNGFYNVVPNNISSSNCFRI